MPIPEFESRRGYLPPGEHEATLEEVEARFATNKRRKEIFEGLRYVVEKLRANGVQEMWLGGSYVTSRERPSDADLVFKAPPGVKTAGWGDVTGMPTQRHVLKKARRVDLWKSPAPQPSKKGGWPPVIDIKDFFASDEDDHPKGLIKLATGGPHD